MYSYARQVFPSMRLSILKAKPTSNEYAPNHTHMRGICARTQMFGAVFYSFILFCVAIRSWFSLHYTKRIQCICVFFLRFAICIYDIN